MTVAKEVAEAFRMKGGVRGFVTALTIVVAILTTVNFIGRIEFRTPTEDKWMSSDGRLGFPSWEEREYELEITSVGEYGGSIDVIAKKIDGWSFDGTFFVGDTILLGDHRVTLTEINLDREKPIHFEYYSLMDLKLPLVIFLAILIFMTVIAWRPE